MNTRRACFPCLQNHRAGERKYPFNEVFWRRSDGTHTHRAILAAVSDNGAALLTAGRYYIRADQILIPSSRYRGWQEPLRIVRVDSISEDLVLACGSFVGDAFRSLPRLKLVNHKRFPGGYSERRQSSRWHTEKCVPWRVYRGRRTRLSRLIERSLNGLVLSARRHDVPRVGTRIVPADANAGERFGFRSARVTRTEPDRAGNRLVFAEIEG